LQLHWFAYKQEVYYSYYENGVLTGFKEAEWTKMLLEENENA